MANNLFVSYDLDAPGQNYAKIIAAIEALGQAVKVHKSLYYVKSNLSAEAAEVRVWAAADGNDRVVVINANDAWWHNAIPPSQDFIQARWHA